MATSASDLGGLRAAWKQAHLAPLWESPTAHKPPAPPDTAHLWAWSDVRPLVERTIEMASPEAVERRVLSLVTPQPRHAEDESTARTLSAALQILLPGERARPHRHSMNALRFILEGSGAITIVNGKECPMEVGDLILTPGWCWHEHVHRGSGPMIWMDALDVPLHLYLGTAAFQPGPVNDMPPTQPDAAYATANVAPDVAPTSDEHSPVFRYPYEAVAAAVAAAPVARDGARRIRYINPLNGRAAMALVDSALVQLEPNRATVPMRSSANAVCCVIEGEGESQVGDAKIAWRKRDIFTLPQNNWISHKSTGTARLFMVSDRDMLARLGLLKDEYRDAA